MIDSQVLTLLQSIAKEGSRNAKEDMFRELVADPLGSWVVKWATDPFITYGVGWDHDLKAYDDQQDQTIVAAQPLLERLSKRTLTGHAAKDAIAHQYDRLTYAGRELFYRILSKDLKCGVGETIIQKLAPGLFPVFSVMRAHPYDPARVKSWPQKAEYKLDGQRNTFICHEGHAGFFTRSGKVVPQLDFMVPTILEVAYEAINGDLKYFLQNQNTKELDFVLDGEAMMGLFADTGVLRRKDVDAVGAELHLYDLMSYEDFKAVGSVGRVLIVRRDSLSKFVRIAKAKLEDRPEAEMIQMVPQFFVNNDEDVQTFFRAAREKTLASYLARGNKVREEELLKTTLDKATGKPKVLEGAMIKDPNGLYDKKKSYGWMKLKAEETEDLRIVGAYPGEPGTKYEDCLGGLILDRNGVLVKVGGGFSDVERLEIWKLWLKDVDWITTNNPGLFHTVKKDLVYRGDPEDRDFELLNRLLEVEFHEVTPDGSLRHSRFVRFRDDKAGEVESEEEAA